MQSGDNQDNIAPLSFLLLLNNLSFFPIFAYASQKTYSETAEYVYCHGTVGHPVFVEKSLHAGTDEIPQTGSDKSAGTYK